VLTAFRYHDGGAGIYLGEQMSLVCLSFMVFVFVLFYAIGLLCLGGGWLLAGWLGGPMA
jgi:hypothetical protein